MRGGAAAAAARDGARLLGQYWPRGDRRKGRVAGSEGSAGLVSSLTGRGGAVAEGKSRPTLGGWLLRVGEGARILLRRRLDACFPPKVAWLPASPLADVSAGCWLRPSLQHEPLFPPLASAVAQPQRAAGGWVTELARPRSPPPRLSIQPGGGGGWMRLVSA